MGNRLLWLITSVFMAVIVGASSPSWAVPIVQQGSGANAAAIQSAVDAFRTNLGNPDNLNAPGPLGSGRREINWDGGGATNGTAAVTPFTVFQNTRGATFTTPGIGMTQTPVTGGTVDIVPGGALQGSLADINPTYASTFVTFSPLRLFTPLGSNIVDATFAIPGTGGAVPAMVSGFGSVFTDVDLANTTSIQYFNANGVSLGTFFAPTANNGLSFLGVSGFDEGIGRVRITTGNTALGPNDGNGVDVAVMDDFLYGEPQVIPEPSSLLLLLTGLSGLAWIRKKTRTLAV
jgi:hypothetical protein